ncbi:MAG: SH3 domain-containing protein [Cyanobacteria bacterium P01_D01_bin.2]
MTLNPDSQRAQPFTLGPWWRGLILVPLLFLMLTDAASAQRRRVIQTPAGYNACNLRSGGGTQYSVLGTFRDNTTVTLLGESGRGWYRVQVQQVTGWMARQCLGL